MYKPIINNEEISIINLISFVRNKSIFLLKACFFITFLYTIYFFIKAPKYNSYVSFYTNYTQGNTIGSLSPLLSSFSGIPESDGLKFSISNFITSDKFFDDIVQNEYTIQNSAEKMTLIDYWGADYNSIFSLNPLEMISKLDKKIILNSTLSVTEKKTYHVKQKLKLALSHKEDRKTSLHKLNFIVKNDPMLAKEIAEVAYNSIVKYSSEVNSVKGLEKKTFIKSRLLDIKNNLEIAESNMLNFKQENQNSFDSPALSLKRDRLQRDIVLYSQLFLSLSDQLELAKIDEKDITSSIFILDKPTIDSNKAGITLINGIIIVFIISFITGLIILIYINKQDLINLRID